MRIIRHGVLPDKIVKKFKCPHCGCLFEATSSEYISSFHRNDERCTCTCPESDCKCVSCYEVDDER